MSYPLAFYVLKDGKEKFLARDLNDGFTFEDDMFAPDVVQAQNADETEHIKAEYQSMFSGASLQTKPFPTL